MTFHTHNKIGKYVQGYGFLSFAKKFVMVVWEKVW